MAQGDRGDQRAGPREMLDDARIGLPDGHPAEVLDPGNEAPVVIHRVVDP